MKSLSRLAAALRVRLCPTPFQGVISFVLLALLAQVGLALWRWAWRDAVFSGPPEACDGSGACWIFVREMGPLFAIGTYPEEQRWRAVTALILLLGLGGAALVDRLRRSPWFLISLPITGGLVLLFLHGPPLFEPVDSMRWGGLLLTLLLALTGIGLSFPLGVLLALGRSAEGLPLLRGLSVAYIELIRGVPLITVLFMASVMVPLVFPEGMSISKVARAQIGIVLFAAAYVAEVVRGGLAAIPRGQIEAARALGLSSWQLTRLIVLPQALRIVVPPLVNTFIALLKDTSLVAIIGLYDLLGIAGLATSNPAWIGRIAEAYVLVGGVYWILCYALSAASRRLEGPSSSATAP